MTQIKSFPSFRLANSTIVILDLHDLLLNAICERVWTESAETMNDPVLGNDGTVYTVKNIHIFMEI